ncbi:multicopper oxidase [Hydnum rufescens UP504]|uniref:Multicopper oxidase n=1 Tax=Hydnum rufescens UP504 TaxID=1448309 RepID=A0A9P6AQI2_9AGAM|nr:multicopper oxidase [Hydnum rufescens UP504]
MARPPRIYKRFIRRLRGKQDNPGTGLHIHTVFPAVSDDRTGFTILHLFSLLHPHDFPTKRENDGHDIERIDHGNWHLVVLALSFAVGSGASPFAAIAPRHSPQDQCPPPSPGNYNLERVTHNTGELNDNFVVTDKPTTRVYNWRVSYAIGAPDGYLRQMIVVNNQYPGPLIEANQGDTIIINVKNDLDTGTGIHFHGISQVGTVWSDGTPGITQCPIPSGGSYTYNFTIQQQSGTFFWHSHLGNTQADGFMVCTSRVTDLITLVLTLRQGPLIVHSPNDAYIRGRDYDHERVLFISDWKHLTAATIVNATFNLPFKQGITFGVPDSILFEGAGAFNCSQAPANATCQQQAPPEIQVQPNKKYRLRVINPGAEAFLTVSIDNHPLNIISADATEVTGPSGVHSVQMSLGERYDFIIDTSEGRNGDAFWLRATVCTKNYLVLPPGFNSLGLAILRYVSDETAPSHQLPTTSDWSDHPLNATSCPGFASDALVPVVRAQVPETVESSWVLNSIGGFPVTAQNVTIFDFYFNNVTWTNLPYDPMLFAVHKGLSLNESIIAHTVFAGSGGADIVINNRDATIDHPYHLHGKAFDIVARGQGVLSADSYAALPPSYFNTSNPLRRDTFVVPRASYAIIRIPTDEPGVFALHCHMGWHLVHGKMGAVVIQPQAIQDLDIPQSALHLCDSCNFPPGVTVDSPTHG